MVAERPAETAPFGGVGGEHEIEAYDQSFEDNQEGAFQYSFLRRGVLDRVRFVQYGGLDNYLLSTKTDLLGQEGMRLRVLVRERRGLKALENAKEVTRAS